MCASAGKTETKRLNVGDRFTVYTTYHSYTNAVLWNYDAAVVEPQHTIYGTTTSIEFKALKAMTLTPSVIQATTYYFKNGTTSSGLNKDVDVFKIYITDNSTVTLNYNNYTLSTDESFYLQANASTGYTGSYTWTSTNPRAANVVGSGAQVRVVAGIYGGESTCIRVTLDNGKYAECTVYVEKIEPTSVSIPSSLTVYVGETQTITPTVYPSNAKTTFNWYCSDPTKVEVSSGTVRGLDEGNTQVYCRTSNYIESNICYVTVLYRKPTGISVSASSVTLNLHQTKQLTYNVQPSNAKTTVTWHSEDTDEKIVRLSSSGLLTPVGPGTTRIYAQTDNNYKGYCQVTVLPDPDEISMSGKMLMMYGDLRKIDYKVTPSNAYSQLTWSSDNSSVVRVGSDGKIEAVGGGSANVTVKTHNGKSATTYVEVPEPNFRMYVWLKNGQSISYPMKSHPKVEFPEESVAISGIDIDAEFNKSDFNRFTFSNDMVSPMPTIIELPSSLNLNYGDRYQIPFTLQPDDYDFETKLSWNTTDSKVAIVNSNGLVTAVGGGEADILCEASNGCKAQCHVAVPEPEFYFVVWFRDGRKSITHLSEKPMMKYDSDVYTFMSSNMEMQYNAADVVKITLADNPEGNISGIHEITEEEKQSQQINILDVDNMIIRGGTPGAITHIYNMSGVLVATYKSNVDGVVMIPLSELPQGLLIIQTEEVIYKIIKK